MKCIWFHYCVLVSIACSPCNGVLSIDAPSRKLAFDKPLIQRPLSSTIKSAASKPPVKKMKEKPIRIQTSFASDQNSTTDHDRTTNIQQYIPCNFYIDGSLYNNIYFCRIGGLIDFVLVYQKHLIRGRRKNQCSQLQVVYQPIVHNRYGNHQAILLSKPESHCEVQ